MFRFLRLCFGTLVRLFRSHHSLLLENLALRQQLVVLKGRHPRPRLNLFDRLFCLLVPRCWSGWKQALLAATPETVVRWHRAGFRWYGRVTSKIRKPVGRRQISKEVRDLIVQMVSENPGWGSSPHPWRTSQCSVLMFPRKNDFSLDETFPSGTLTQPGAGSPFFATTGKPSLRWISSRFPRSPSVYSTASFVIAHDRRRILLRNVTKHPTSLWIVQQLREAFPFKRLLYEYISYHHEERPHLGLGKETPGSRTHSRCSPGSTVETVGDQFSMVHSWCTLTCKSGYLSANESNANH
jgi:putative transposase